MATTTTTTDKQRSGVMLLASVTFPKDAVSFRCGTDTRNTWLSGIHDCRIWIDGEFVWVQKGASKAFAHVSRIAHAVPA